MSSRQTIVMAVVIALVCAAVVWWLERFERQRLRDDWQGFIVRWQAQASGGAAGSGGDGGAG